jgi:8-oxo-dGTP pyrophosphatase MutT (NUDIX family)
MNDEIPKPVRPRDAASVVLIRGKGARAEVLMGRRRKRASFLPNIYVFPGGRVDTADHRTIEGLELHPETERHLRRHTPATSTLALALAGLRETHEETGYLISRDADSSALAGAPATPFWNALRQEGSLPDLARMDYIARALTPTMSHKRFNTRFFLVDANDARGDLVQDGELEDLHWVALDAAHRLPIVDVTEFVLNRARARWRDRQAGKVQTSVPFLHYFRNRQRIDDV